MMKDLILVHQQQQSVLEENMSNLTSASNEASASSSVNRNDSGNGSIYPPPSHPHQSFLQDMMNSFSSSSGFEGSTAFEDALKDDIIGFHDALFSKAPPPNHREEGGGGHGGGGGGNDGMTRDFLGLRPLSHHDIFNIAGLGNCMNTHQNTNQRSSWQG